jgi:lipoprotein NlpI
MAYNKEKFRKTHSTSFYNYSISDPVRFKKRCKLSYLINNEVQFYNAVKQFKESCIPDDGTIWPKHVVTYMKHKISGV